MSLKPRKKRVDDEAQAPPAFNYIVYRRIAGIGLMSNAELAAAVGPRGRGLLTVKVLPNGKVLDLSARISE